MAFIYPLDMRELSRALYKALVHLVRLIQSDGGTGDTPKKPKKLGKSKKNFTHSERRLIKSNPGRIGWRRALSPLRHPCCPCTVYRFSLWFRK